MITARGTTRKQVLCKQCGNQYDYPLERMALGSCSGFAWTQKEATERAAQDASEQLDRLLETECNVVPCLKCGAITQEMKAAERDFVPSLFRYLCLGAAIVGGVYAVGVWTGHWYIIAGLTGAFLFVICALVSMPPPEESPQAYFVALVQTSGGSDPKAWDQGSVSARIFTLELAQDSNPENAVLGEWVKEGQHRMIGFGVKATREACLKAVGANLDHGQLPLS